jgi:anti-sigma factor RsiW
MTLEPRASDQMECRDLERSLDAYLDGEFDERERSDAAAHLAVCAPCRSLTEQQQHLRDGLRGCLRRALGGEAGEAPAALRLRVVEALAHERRPAWRRAAPVVLAAAIAAALLLALLPRGASGPDPIVVESASRHARDLPLEISAASVGPESIASWFAGKLDFNPRPPRFAQPEVRLVGARLSHVGDHPAAYMRYALPRGHMGGLFIVEDREHRCCGGGRELRAGTQLIHLANAHGYTVAVWRRNEIVYSLVADLDEDEVAALLRSISMQGAER